MRRILIVSVEPPWPAHHGGRIRTARIAEALGRRHDVLVAFPDHGEAEEGPGIPVHRLAWSPPSSRQTRLSAWPHLGGYFLASAAGELAALAARFGAEALFWSHSYLAPWAPPSLSATPQVIEFANIESQRLRSLARTGARVQKAARLVEAAKAARWEPQVARGAALCVALSEPDLRQLRTWKANAMLVANGVDTFAYQPSPVDGYVLALASHDYEPNVAASRHLVGEVWPKVVQRVPGARLVIAGRRSEALRAEFEGAPGVTVAGTLADVSPVYRGAAVAVAAATSGGGSQLKLTEALARGRSVVMSPFAAQGMPPALRGSGGYRVGTDADAFAEAISVALTDPAGRHARELAAIEACRLLTWDRVVDGLSDALEAMGGGGRQ